MDKEQAESKQFSWTLIFFVFSFCLFCFFFFGGGGGGRGGGGGVSDVG